MTNNSWIAIALVLVVGFGAGYLIGQSKPATVVQVDTASSDTAHMMPDGSMMGGDVMSMEDMMEQMSAELAGKTGDAFDQAFLAEMIIHHQGAVEMAEQALENAKHAEIKDLAEAIIEAQNKEIADMKAWQAEWYGE